MAEKWENLQVNGLTMRAFVCTPDGPGPHPAMVVIQHAGGVDNFIQDMTRRSAEAGYTSIAPDLYHREDPNSTDDGMTKLGRLQDTNIVADVNAVPRLHTGQRSRQRQYRHHRLLYGRSGSLPDGRTEPR